VFGVRGGKHLEEIKTWSTAQSVIVLSRILNTAYVLLPKINSYQSDLQDKELNRLKECLINEKELNKKHQKFVTSATKFLNEEYLSDKSIKSIKLFGNLVFLALCLCALFFLKDPIQTVWPKVEGLIWLIAQIVVIISAWFSAQCH
jgi:hypothetical protein